MPHITVPELNINYQTSGKGTPLLLIIGLSFSLIDWGNYFPSLLAKKYQVTLFDNRDSGLTTESNREYTIEDLADDTAHLLDALNITSSHVLGVSMGGMVAQQLALRHPNKVSKLILCSTMTGGICSQYYDASNLISALFTGNLPKLLFPENYLNTHKNEIKQLFTKSSPHHSQDQSLKRQLQAFSSYDACNTIQQIRAKTLILTGDIDQVIPTSNSLHLNQKIKHSTLKIIPGGGHGLCFSHADQVASLIIKFLK